MNSDTMSFPKHLHVLLVEDSPGGADLIREAIEMEGDRPIHLSACATLAEAVQLLGATQIDLVLLDLNLPDSTGEQTLEKLRAAVPHIPVVVLTSSEDQLLGQRCTQAGAIDYLVRERVESFIVHAIYNVAGRAVAQKAVEHSYDNLKRILDDARAGMLVLAMDNTVRFANNTARALFGERARPGEALGVFSVGPGQTQVLDIPHPDGRATRVEVSVSETLWYGDPARVIVFHDVTMQSGAEEALKASEEKYRLMVETSRNSLFICRNDRFIFFNQAFEVLLGYTRKELLAKTHRGICTEEAAGLLEERTLKRRIGETVPGRYELTYRRKDGTPVIVEVNERIINYHGQETTFAVIEDITRKKGVLKMLKASAAQDKELEGVIPICAYCYKIRDDEEKEHPWVPPADYLTKHVPQLRFSHGICDVCMNELYPEDME